MCLYLLSFLFSFCHISLIYSLFSNILILPHIVVSDYIVLVRIIIYRIFVLMCNDLFGQSY